MGEKGCIEPVNKAVIILWQGCFILRISFPSRVKIIPANQRIIKGGQLMSSHGDLSSLNHTQKDILKEIIKLQNLLKWVLLIAITGATMSLLSFAIVLFK